MFTLIAKNHFNTVEFEESYLEWELAEQMFNVARKCVDCKCAVLLNAATGEVILDWDAVKHILEDYR